ncbi:ATP adenylyltransferase [Peniophora sp. CONT]|nr:ATP adenylyltransferase [Peniophora sp. CONT]
MSTPAHSAIIKAIPAAFDAAKASGDLLFFDSEIRHHTDCDLNFRLTLCPALLHKPTPSSTESAKEEKKKDPFAPPYVEKLHVGELTDEVEGDEYVVLLNKYSVVPHHFLLCTKDFQSQNAPLNPSDLVQAYALLLAANKAGQNYFAFYNCGKDSGASQAHKHVQFIPADEDGPPIEELASTHDIDKEDKAFALPSLPFAHHIRRLELSPRSSHDAMDRVLTGAYVSLLDLVISTIRAAPDHPGGTPSYNVVLTRRHLILVPRSKENGVLSKTGEELSINALGFAGMLLVKCEEEMNAVIEEGPAKILASVACKSVHEEQVKGGPELDGDMETN